jgi:hypothetical protein
MQARLQPRERRVTLSSTPQDPLTYYVAPTAPVFSKVKIMEQVGRISPATSLTSMSHGFCSSTTTLRRHMGLWIECHDGKLRVRLEGSHDEYRHALAVRRWSVSESTDPKITKSLSTHHSETRSCASEQKCAAGDPQPKVAAAGRCRQPIDTVPTAPSEWIRIFDSECSLCTYQRSSKEMMLPRPSS